MGTFLFDKVVFGPVNSRRLGISLGINLLPVNTKYCSFNCIYCECGWTPGSGNLLNFPARIEIHEKLQARLQVAVKNNEKIDALTFAGNGEPTLHPKFPQIINDTIVLRKKYLPESQIVVLSNASTLHDKRIVKALRRVDKNILKLDSVNEETFLKLNQPKNKILLSRIINNLEQFEEEFILQIMLVRGRIGDIKIDNSTREEINGFLSVLPRMKPKSIMLYTIARETPLKGLKKIPVDKLNSIAARFESAGYTVHVAG